MFKSDKKNYLQIATKKFVGLSLLCAMLVNLVLPFTEIKALSTSILDDEKEDTYLFETTDNIITTKTGLERNIPETFGKYDRSEYPIPGVQTCKQALFEDIKAENREIMTNLEEKIANGTLKKHIAADGQYYGTVPDDAKAVEKIAYINTNLEWTHSLGVFIPGGEIATITIPEEYLSYFISKKMRIVVGAPTGRPGESLNAEDYNKGGKSRMQYLDYSFFPTSTVTKVGTPLGGMIYVQFSGMPQGLEIPITVTGAVDTPYYDLGRTTKEEWDIARNAPGTYAEFRTPYMRFACPASAVRNIEDPKDILTFWYNVAATSTYAFGSTYRTSPITMIFDTYVPAGAAVAFVGAWFCVQPADWAASSLNYANMTKNGGWGTLHEFNHHWQGTYFSQGRWGLGSPGEITNNVMNIASYLQFTNIAMKRSEISSIGGWETSTDPYYNLVTTINNWQTRTSPETSCYMYATFMHEFGVKNFLEVVKSYYSGGTYNNIEVSAYNGSDKYDDMAYRMCAIFGKDLTMYMKDVLKWNISAQALSNIKALGFEEYIPVQNLYATGVKGVETGRAFFIPALDSYTFDFEKYTKTPGEVLSITATTPKYGTIKKQQNGTYLYKPNFVEMQDKFDEFDLVIKVKQNNVTNERTLHVKLALKSQMSILEKYNITQSDLNLAIEETETKEPYSVSYPTTVNYNADNGVNVSKGIGNIQVPSDGKYEFQAYGDDKVKFILKVGNSEYSSETKSFTGNITSAYANKNSTKFTVDLKKGTTYAYTLYCYNGGGAGNGKVGYRLVGEENFKDLPAPLLRNGFKETVTTDMVQPTKPTYIRKLVKMRDKAKVDLAGTEILITPAAQPGAGNLAENMLDGNYNTFFHSKYSGGGITAFPHQYVLDLKETKTFNQIDIYTRNSNTNGTIGDYELYISDDNVNWTKFAEDNNRQGNNTKGVTISVILDKEVSGRYLKIVAKNNKGGNNFTIISEIELFKQSNSNAQIAQNSSKIEYEGSWEKKVGIYNNGAVYKTTSGAFNYSILGTSTMIYSRTNAKVKIKIDNGKWKEYNVTGSKTDPSVIIRDLSNDVHNIQVKVVEGELELDLLATDGKFMYYTGEGIVFNSKVYKIDKYISKIKPETTLKELKSNIDTNLDIEVEDKDGKALTDNGIITTGMTLTAGDEIEYKLVVTGDLDGDGEITITDLVKFRLYSVHKKTPTDMENVACDMDYDGEAITITDLVIFNLVSIGAKSL